MPERSAYEREILERAAAAIAKGHTDPDNLRELLIWTTSTTTSEMAQAYFRQHHHDRDLLRDLVAIALEGEDAGDAPWAAANTIAEFPASMLGEFKEQLVQLSEHPWMYLHIPAKKALGKLQAEDK